MVPTVSFTTATTSRSNSCRGVGLDGVIPEGRSLLHQEQPPGHALWVVCTEEMSFGVSLSHIETSLLQPWPGAIS